MIRRLTAILALLLFSAGPALADQQLITESRHPTALENRRARAKVTEKLEEDGFRPMPRIVGGRPAANGEYPWQVALLDADEDDEYDALFCGGTLIHPRWVLTAAHCVLGSRVGDIEVLVGATDLNAPGSAQRIAVSEIILSPHYNEITMDSDFALLRLAEPAKGTVMPVIDDSDLMLPGIEATVTGWGDTSAGEADYPNRLQEVELPIVDLALANASPAYDGTLTENMLAAGVLAGGKDSCQGDSGGPLLVPSPLAPGWMQAGVVSFGEGCAQPGVYGIYTRIGNYRNFITGHIRPYYAAWEMANDRTGEGRDPDNNGRTNFEEFALPNGGVEKEVSGSFLYLRYLRPYDAPEVKYVLEHATSAAGPWFAGGGTELTKERLLEGMANAVHRLAASENYGVFRVRAEYSSDLAHGPRPLTVPGGATGRLDPSDRVISSRRTNVYQLFIPEDSGPLAVSLRSGEFKAKVRLQTLGEDGSTVEIDENDGVGFLGTDEHFEFTPEAGRSYQLWVTTTDTEETGAYELNLWDPSALDGVPLLANSAVNGSLTTADLPDPFFLPGSNYFKDDYRLDTAWLPAGKLLELRMKSKGNAAKGIDDFLSLIDAESGRLVSGNDNFAGKSNDAGLRFIPVPGKSYLLRASSGVEDDTGLYSLTAGTPALGAKSQISQVGIGARVAGKLSAASELDERYFTFKRDYLLSGATPGQKLFVTLEAKKFDAYLIVLDASDLSPVEEGDVGGPAGGRDNARLEFTPGTGRQYLIRATTYDPNEKGAFTLATGVAP